MSLRAWRDDLQVSGQAAPRGKGGVVIQLDPLFVALLEPWWRGRVPEQVFEILRNPDVTVAHPEGVPLSSGDEPASTEADGGVPANRIRVAIGQARHSKHSQPRV